MSDPVLGAVVVNPFGITDVGTSSDLAFVDIDGDGDLDLFSGSWTAGTVTFFRNTGSAVVPVFAAEASAFGLSGTQGSSLAFGDVDGDGDADAFVGNYDGTTTFFRNTGSASAPTFVAQASNFGLPDVGSAAKPALVDIDADGDLDAFVGNYAGFTLFFRKTGTASAPVFTQEADTFGIGDAGIQANPTFADVDGDGDMDAFVGGVFGENYFLRNVGTPSAPKFSWEAYNFGISPDLDDSSPVLVDIDADGDLDVFVGDGDGNTYYHRNADTPVRIIQSGSDTAVTEGGATDTYTVVLDRAPTATVTVSLYWSPQVGSDVTKLTFTTANWNVAQTVTVRALNDKVAEDTHVGQIYHTVKSADTRFNGIADSIGVTVNDNDIRAIHLPLGPATANPYGLADVGFYASPAFVDIDADGDMDMFVGNDAGDVAFYRNTGTQALPAFSIDTSIVMPDPGDFFGDATPTFADIDDDGDFDAFVGDYDDVLFYKNVGTAWDPVFVKEVYNFGLGSGGKTVSPDLVDIDDDGDLDAFVSDVFGATSFYRNTGTPAAAAFVKEGGSFGLAGASLSFADIDGDGDYDAIAGDWSQVLVLYRNTGTAKSPVFVEDTIIRYTEQKTDPTFVDIDADGDMDLVVGTYDGNIWVHLNTPNAAPVFDALSAMSYIDTAYDDTFYVKSVGLVATDGDGDALAWGIVGGSDTGDGAIVKTSAYGDLVLDIANSTLFFSPDEDAIEALGAAASVSFTITVSDGIETRQRVLKVNLAQSGTTETAGADLLTGNDGDNWIDGLAGNDTLNGALGADTLIGGAGHDILDGGRGIDAMAGGIGNDNYFVRDVGDYVEELPGQGLDLVLSYIGAYTLPSDVEDGQIMAAGKANLTGNGLKNTLRAGAGDNVMSGGAGRDTVTYEYASAAVSVSLAVTVVQDTKGSGFDRLVSIENLTGSDYNDTLTGSGGANVLAGGAGQDILTGGLGADGFVFRWATESAVGATRDQVTDFSAAQGDWLDLWGIDADEAAAGNQAFTNLVSSATLYSATTTFTGASAGPGQLYYDQTRQVLFGNTDADTAAEFSISLKGVGALTMDSLVA